MTHGLTYCFGRFELAPEERALRVEGRALHLGGRAFDVLVALVERRDRIVDFDELLDVVWPGLAVEENNLSVQISALRKALGTDAIATIRGRGYRFTAPLRSIQTGARVEADTTISPEAQPAAPSSKLTLRDAPDCEVAISESPLEQPPTPLDARDGLGRPPMQAPDQSWRECRPSIAVLPFECLTPGSADDALGEALSDDVIMALCRARQFLVISGMSSRRLRRSGLPPARLAATLEADYLLTGTYRTQGSHWVLQLQLQDAVRASVLRGLCFERSLQDILASRTALIVEIASEITDALCERALQRSLVDDLPELDNHSLLLGAIGLMHAGTLATFERSRRLLEALGERRGGAGTANSWLAKWHVVRVAQGWSTDPAVDAGCAWTLVHRALESNPRNSLALSIGGLVQAYLYRDMDRAGQMYGDALDVNDSEPFAWLFSATREAYLGRAAEAVMASERALQLSPIDPMKYYFDSLAATAALAPGLWERSVALSQRSLKANKMHASTWRTLAYALVELDRVEEARMAVRRLLSIEPGYSVARFMERFPGRDGPLMLPWARALQLAGLPN